MKKAIIIITVLLSLLLVSCSGGSDSIELGGNKPNAFSVLEKQLTLNKQSKKGEAACFTKDDFSNLLGESITYITVTELPENASGTLIFNGAAVTKGQTLSAGLLEYLKYVPNKETTDSSFIFTCDSASFGGIPIRCEMSFTESTNLPPAVTDKSISTVAGITCNDDLEIFEPNGDSYTINVITYPRNGFITVNKDGSITYCPEADFSGRDTLVYTVTDRFGAVSETATLAVNVDKNESGIYFADMKDNSNHLYAHRMCQNNTMVYRCENGEYYFDPEKTVSKIEFLVMMMSVTKQDADIVAVADSAVSDDTGLSSGLKGYLSAASEKGLIKLVDGAFSPKDDITVADAAYMIAAALDLPGMDKESISAGTVDRTFASILAATDAGFFNAAEPSHRLTKQETARLLCRLADYVRDNNM